jgi:hypothetical protein
MATGITADGDPPRGHLRADAVHAGKIPAELEASVSGTAGDDEQVAEQAPSAVGFDRQAGDRRRIETGEAVGHDPAEIDGERGGVAGNRGNDEDGHGGDRKPKNDWAAGQSRPAAQSISAAVPRRPSAGEYRHLSRGAGR